MLVLACECAKGLSELAVDRELAEEEEHRSQEEEKVVATVIR